ncbi:MAG: cohesin domain-containing protein, partial [Pyrinomonadaceae bacterium]
EKIYGRFMGRQVLVGQERAIAGETIDVPIEIVPYGDEVAIGFTLEYDSTKLSNPHISLGESAPKDSVLTFNTFEKGRIGVLVDSTEATTASAIAKRVVIVTFDVAPDAIGETRIALSSSLAAKGLSDSAGNELFTRWFDGLINISRR